MLMDSASIEDIFLLIFLLTRKSKKLSTKIATFLLLRKNWQDWDKFFLSLNYPIKNKNLFSSLLKILKDNSLPDLFSTDLKTILKYVQSKHLHLEITENQLFKILLSLLEEDLYVKKQDHLLIIAQVPLKK